METITFSYEGDITSKATTNVDTVVVDDGLFLGDVLEAFAAFLRAAGYTYVHSVAVRTDNNPEFTTYANPATPHDDAFEADWDAYDFTDEDPFGGC